MGGGDLEIVRAFLKNNNIIHSFQMLKQRKKDFFQLYLTMLY